MGIVVAVAVLREGGEVVLFLYGIAVSAKLGAIPLLTGGALGVAAGAIMSWLLYRGLIAIPLHRLFRRHLLAHRPARRGHGRAGR